LGERVQGTFPVSGAELQMNQRQKKLIHRYRLFMGRNLLYAGKQ